MQNSKRKYVYPYKNRLPTPTVGGLHSWLIPAAFELVSQECSWSWKRSLDCPIRHSLSILAVCNQHGVSLSVFHHWTSQQTLVLRISSGVSGLCFCICTLVWLVEWGWSSTRKFHLRWCRYADLRPPMLRMCPSRPFDRKCIRQLYRHHTWFRL